MECFHKINYILNLNIGNLRCPSRYFETKFFRVVLKQYGGSEFKASACPGGDLSSIPGLGTSPGEGNGNPLQFSCLENPMDRRGWQAAVYGFTRIGHDWRLSTQYMSIESGMLSNRLILSHSLLFPSIFLSFRVFSNEWALHIKWPKYWSLSISFQWIFMVHSL